MNHDTLRTERRFILSLALTGNLALLEEFDIEHTTIQFECESCGQGAVVCVIGG